MAVLIVDDEKNIRDSIVRFLQLEQIEAVAAENGLSARRLLKEQVFEAAVIDLKMPGMDGLQLLQWLQAEGPELPVIMISAFGEISDAVQAMKLGARDYIVKPFDPEELTLRLKRLLTAKNNQDRVRLAAQPSSGQNQWIGTSPGSQAVKQLIDKVAATPSTILITGESGTGKEVTARLIHQLSPRASHPFVPLNLGGIPETLLESELFGYEKGAFTGAATRKPGLAETASGGTLFLDEIGEASPALQVKLLRFIQEKKIQRLGSTVTLPVDVRILAATNRDLQEMVREKTFREDLYYRLNVINLKIPPLRERREDIPLLVGHFIGKFNVRLGKQIKKVSPAALDALLTYLFPGNIRELENMLERAMILATSQELHTREFELPGPAVEKISFKGTIQELEKQAIRESLARWEGNRTKAATELGITRRTLFNKMKEFDL